MNLYDFLYGIIKPREQINNQIYYYSNSNQYTMTDDIENKDILISASKFIQLFRENFTRNLF
jgi:hypothetical protein